MATLSGQTIANTFDSILHVEDDTAGLVATATDSRVIQDGVGVNSALALATDSVRITSTNKLYFNDAGAEEIHSASDGHLEVNSGTTLDITAPTVDINASTAVTVDGPAVTIADGTGSKPLIIVKNTANDTTGSELRFVMDKGSAGADGDDLGTISFYGDDAGQNQTAFAKIVAEVSEADETDEAGKLSFYVAESDGTNTALTAGLILEGEHATDGEVDVTIGAGASSTTTIAGNLSVTGTGAGASTIGALTDVTMDIANFVDGILIQPDSDGSAPTTGTLNGATGNIGIGKGVFTALTEGSYNTALGYSSLESNTTGDSNVATGYLALNSNTEGNGNTASGVYALQANTTALYGTASGLYALKSNTEGNSNVALGAFCLYSNTEGADNSACGYAALYAVTTGDNNIGIGKNSGRNDSPSGDITTADNIICLGDDNIATLYCTQSSISTSDSRDKTDITDFDGGLDWVNAMQPKTFNWDRRSWYLDDELDGESTSQDVLDATPDGTKKRDDLQLGFLAQDILAIEQANGYADNNENSLLVNLTGDGTRYGLAYERIVPVLVNAIKELSAKVEALENA